MNRDEAKNILLLYRHGTADTEDPQIAEALALARREPELARWLEEHCARQFVLREKFRQITAPAGLLEQIISEHAAGQKVVFWRQKSTLAILATLVVLATLAPLWYFHSAPEDTLGIYQNRMAGLALRGYAMDLETNRLEPVRAYLALSRAPADFKLPAPLQKVELAGCAVQSWQGAKVAIVCFRTSPSLPPGQSSDLWLFVVDRASVRGVLAGEAPQFSRANRLTTAVWTQGDKLYLLGTEGDEQTLRRYL